MEDDSFMQIVRERLGGFDFLESQKNEGLFFNSFLIAGETFYVDMRKKPMRMYGYKKVENDRDVALDQEYVDKMLADVRKELVSIGCDLKQHGFGDMPKPKPKKMPDTEKLIERLVNPETEMRWYCFDCLKAHTILEKGFYTEPTKELINCMSEDHNMRQEILHKGKWTEMLLEKPLPTIKCEIELDQIKQVIEHAKESFAEHLDQNEYSWTVFTTNQGTIEIIIPRPEIKKSDQKTIDKGFFG